MTQSAPIPDPPASVDPSEIAKFNAMADEWWDPAGKFAPLHKFNPVRLKYIRETAASHFCRDARALSPFEGLTLLDIGCGGGLLSEPMSRMGFETLGADASQKNVSIASTHAARSGLSGRLLSYRPTTAEALAREGRTFDTVLNMEVVEHVADLGSYLTSCARLVKPGGLMFVATLNRTLKSLAQAKFGAEYILGWLPRGTHDWNRFIEPAKLRLMLEECGLNTLKIQGIAFDPFRWDWSRSDDVSVNYILVVSN